MPETAEAPSFAELAGQIDAAAAQGEPAAPITTAPKAPAQETSAPPTPPAKTDPKTPDAKPEAPAKEESSLTKLMGKKEKVADKPATSPKPDEKPIDWKTAPKEFRERFEQLSTEHKTIAQQKQEAEKRVSEYESKIKEIESKKGEASQPDLKLVEEYTKKISDYEATVRELDYSRSREYTTLKSEYVEKYNRSYIEAANELKGFQVKTGEDVSGNAITRQFTDADLQALAGKSVAEQRRLTREMFGADSDVANSHLDELRRIANEANFTLSKKLEDAKVNGEKRTAEQRLSEQKQKEEYDAHSKAIQAQLESEFPELTTAPKDDPEGAEALKRGQEFVDTVLQKVGSMTVKDRAEHNAVLRARVAASFLQEHQMAKLNEQIKSLTDEITSFRNADPGKGGGKINPTPPKDSIGGIAELAAKFNEG